MSGKEYLTLMLGVLVLLKYWMLIWINKCKYINMVALDYANISIIVTSFLLFMTSFPGEWFETALISYCAYIHISWTCEDRNLSTSSV